MKCLSFFSRFELLDGNHSQIVAEDVRQRLRNRPSVDKDGSLRGTANKYQPDKELRTAINTAIAVSQPLLLSGEAGTGKTQVAYYVGYRLNLPVFHFQARSTSVANDLLYHFDTVRYFHDAYIGQLDKSQGLIRMKSQYVTPCQMWQAFTSAEQNQLPSILLIDEIDKAPRDFPNDLLHEISEMSFQIKEVPEHEPISCDRALRPLVFITSNDERRLPDAFLRRCVSHYIDMTPELLERVALSHRDEYPRLNDNFIRKAIDRFVELRGRKLEKKPASCELLAWLQVLSVAVGQAPERLDVDLADLPYLSTLLKSPDVPRDLR